MDNNGGNRSVSPYAETQTVGEERSIGVTPLWEVNNAQELGEEDDIDQVGAERPQSVDGWDGESHVGGHAAHHKDGYPHDPHDLILTGALSEDELVDIPGEH